MNYSEVYIFGAEQSWVQDITVDESNNVYVGHVHFYKEKGNTTQPIKNGKRENMNLSEIFGLFSITFRGYLRLKEYAKYKKVTIFNATPNSFIDAFERKSSKDLMIK